MHIKEEPRFLVDFMLGRLAKWLRLLGFDTAYVTERNTAQLIARSQKENRILLTRDHRLTMTKTCKTVFIGSDKVTKQLRQLIDAAGLRVTNERMFSRCTLCNVNVDAVADPTSIKDLVPAYVYETQKSFLKCPQCGKIYWTGTHRELLLKDLEKAGIKCLSLLFLLWYVEFGNLICSIN